MKTKSILIITIIISLFASCLSFANDKPLKNYGKDLTAKKVTKFKDAVSNPGKFKNKDILVEGTVKSVCQTKGCWMEITDGKETMRVKFEGYSFFVPYDSKGKKVKIQGKVNRETVKEATYKHWLEEAGEPAEFIDKIKGDQKVVMFTATGVVMEEGSEFTPEQLDKIQGKTKKEGSEGHNH